MISVIVCFAAVFLVVLAPSAADSLPAAAGQPAVLRIAAGSQPIPPSFLGLSVEYDQLSIYEREGAVFDRVISLLAPQDGTKLVLRIGGRSADRTYFRTTSGRPIPYGVAIGEGWLQRLTAIAARDRLRVMLDLNLAIHSTALATRFAAVARLALGSALAGLEIGNEPDLYWAQGWLNKERVPSNAHAKPNEWARNYSPADYRRDYGSYARALVSTLPGIALGAPETSNASPDWLSSVEGLGRRTPSFLSIHRYPASSCRPRKSPYYPSIALLLSELSSGGFADRLRAAAAFAHRRHQALRLTEMNSISCGGAAGVADSFATALWAPDALFALIRAGVASVNWHLRPTLLTAPFTVAGSRIRPLPELYGLALFADMTQPGGRLLNTQLTHPTGSHLKAWAVRSRTGTQVLLLNKRPRPETVRLKLGTSGVAVVKRLLAPSVSSTAGVTFAGQAIGSQGRWQGHETQTRVRPANHAYDVSLPGYSAALVAVG